MFLQFPLQDGVQTSINTRKLARTCEITNLGLFAFKIILPTRAPIFERMGKMAIAFKGHLCFFRLNLLHFKFRAGMTSYPKGFATIAKNRIDSAT